MTLQAGTSRGGVHGCPRVDFNSLLGSAIDACSEPTAQGIALPWEQGVFKQIFESEDAVSWNDTFALPALPIPDDSA